MEPATGWAPEQVFAQLVDLLEEVAGVTPDTVGWDSVLRDDLGVDSLQMQDLVIVCERRFGVEIAEDDLPRLRTVRQVVDHVGGLAR